MVEHGKATNSRRLDRIELLLVKLKTTKHPHAYHIYDGHRCIVDADIAGFFDAVMRIPGSSGSRLTSRFVVCVKFSKKEVR